MYQSPVIYRVYNLSLLPLIQGYKIRETPLSCDLPSVQLVIATSDTRIQDQGDPASLTPSFEYKRTHYRSDVLVVVEVNVSVSCDLPSVQLVIATSDTSIKDQGDPASP
ncbi:hypothetical protein J6590_105145 [Homalodisca vitripennis]|nr:hypothetical protein J6590_105145 [Homalodisca vitripennis]